MTEVTIDPELVERYILELARPYHELAEAYLNTPVATSPSEQSAQLGRVLDSSLVDAVHQVQLYYAKADVSTSCTRSRATARC